MTIPSIVLLQSIHTVCTITGSTVWKRWFGTPQQQQLSSGTDNGSCSMDGTCQLPSKPQSSAAEGMGVGITMPPTSAPPKSDKRTWGKFLFGR